MTKNNERSTENSRGSGLSPVIANRGKKSAKEYGKSKMNKNVGSLSMYNAVKGIEKRGPIVT